MGTAQQFKSTYYLFFQRTQFSGSHQLTIICNSHSWNLMPWFWQPSGLGTYTLHQDWWLSKLPVALRGQASPGTCGSVLRPKPLSKFPCLPGRILAESMAPMGGHTTAPLAAVWLGAGQCGVQQRWKPPLDHNLTKKGGVLSLCLSPVSWKADWLHYSELTLEESVLLAPPSSHIDWLPGWSCKRSNPPSLVHYIWVT